MEVTVIGIEVNRGLKEHGNNLNTGFQALPIVRPEPREDLFSRDQKSSALNPKSTVQSLTGGLIGRPQSS